MKILSLAFADHAGASYSLCHAINKTYIDHKAVALRASNNYLNYPTMGDLGIDYSREVVQNMIEKADILVFHSSVQPYMAGLQITPEFIQDKTKILYFHGSEMRKMGKPIIEQADEYFGEYKICISTPDLKEYTDKKTYWTPVARSFKEISTKYQTNYPDQRALEAFDAPKQKKVRLGHAPTNEQMKGSHIFYRAITEAMKTEGNAEYVLIKDTPWDSCLRTLSGLQVYYDQCILGAYGLASVEASIFKIPVICNLKPEVAEDMEKYSGIPNPFIQFDELNTLIEQTKMLIQLPKLREAGGEGVYKYCKAVHDEKPVAKRFLEVIKD